jgi:hypothetical protein
VLSCLTDTTAAAAAAAAAAGDGSGSSTGGLQQQQQRRGGGHSAWVCETWLVTLSAQQVPTTQQQSQQSQLLVLSEPCLEEGELPPGELCDDMVLCVVYASFSLKGVCSHSV